MAHMSVGEKISRYVGRIRVFEEKNNWVIGKYGVSEWLVILIVALLFAHFVPQFVSQEAIVSAITILVVIYLIYIILCFRLSGGRGKVVDVLN